MYSGILSEIFQPESMVKVTVRFWKVECKKIEDWRIWGKLTMKVKVLGPV